MMSARVVPRGIDVTLHSTVESRLCAEGPLAGTFSAVAASPIFVLLVSISLSSSAAVIRFFPSSTRCNGVAKFGIGRSGRPGEEMVRLPRGVTGTVLSSLNEWPFSSCTSTIVGICSAVYARVCGVMLATLGATVPFTISPATGCSAGWLCAGVIGFNCARRFPMSDASGIPASGAKIASALSEVMLRIEFTERAARVFTDGCGCRSATRTSRSIRADSRLRMCSSCSHTIFSASAAFRPRAEYVLLMFCTIPGNDSENFSE